MVIMSLMMQVRALSIPLPAMVPMTTISGRKKLADPIPSTVNADGYYTKDAPGFEGGRVIDQYGKWGDANRRVMDALKEAGMLLSAKRKTISYPHSWRSKKPIIFRNTPQWFISMSSHGLRDKALKAIEDTKFFPPAGQNRLRGMIADRPDWVISRQRAWGVPIAVFVNKETGKILNDSKVNQRIAESFSKEGADAWFADGAASRFLGLTTTIPRNGNRCAIFSTCGSTRAAPMPSAWNSAPT